MGCPPVDVVFHLWQCDKENHGWREGPPLTVPLPKLYGAVKHRANPRFWRYWVSLVKKRAPSRSAIC